MTRKKRLPPDERKKRDRLTDEQSDLAAANSPLILWVVKQRRTARIILGRDACVSAAGLGLCRAARSYDETKGMFSTLASRCMHHEIDYELMKVYRKCRFPARPDGQPATMTSIGRQDIHGERNAEIDRIDARDWMQSLVPFQRTVLERQLQGMTLKDIGDELGFTKEYMRKIKNRGLSHL